MRARGLKRPGRLRHRIIELVAPHAGAWIETGYGNLRATAAAVAPHAGAWIETRRPVNTGLIILVAPHAGAWIETGQGQRSGNGVCESRPMRARGLKLVIAQVPDDPALVAPHAGAWIETSAVAQVHPPALSRAPCGRVD